VEGAEAAGNKPRGVHDIDLSLVIHCSCILSFAEEQPAFNIVDIEVANLELAYDNLYGLQDAHPGAVFLPAQIREAPRLFPYRT
jgi:hypothetical protein